MTSPEVRKLLMETAFLSCLMNDTGRARTILTGLGAEGLEPALGLGLADLTDGDAASASNRFRPLADAGDKDAVVLLAVALKSAGRTAECDALLARHANVPELQQLAASLR